MPSREEFRGTGGSLYFLRVQDVLEGSERIRIEVRDKASGLVTGVTHLRPTVDYDIDYLQGRVLLSDPLDATTSDGLLVRNAGLGALFGGIRAAPRALADLMGSAAGCHEIRLGLIESHGTGGSRNR